MAATQPRSASTRRISRQIHPRVDLYAFDDISWSDQAPTAIQQKVSRVCGMSLTVVGGSSSREKLEPCLARCQHAGGQEET